VPDTEKIAAAVRDVFGTDCEIVSDASRVTVRINEGNAKVA
jgi:hypothetical protein